MPLRLIQRGLSLSKTFASFRGALIEGDKAAKRALLSTPDVARENEEREIREKIRHLFGEPAAGTTPRKDGLGRKAYSPRGGDSNAAFAAAGVHDATRKRGAPAKS